MQCPRCGQSMPDNTRTCGNCGEVLTPAAPAPDTITFKRSHFVLALLPVSFVLGLVTGFAFWELIRNRPLADAGRAITQEAPAAPLADTGAIAGPLPKVDVSADDDPAFGPAEAPITIIEFSDFECPFCQRYFRQTHAALIAAYPDQIRFVYRDFPLSGLHAQAVPAAEAAGCAFEQGRFWQFHDALLQSEEDLSPALYARIAEGIDLDVAAFNECVATRRYAEEVQADYADGLRAGVSGTPTFFINGVPLVGAQPLSGFQQIIDRELMYLNP